MKYGPFSAAFIVVSICVFICAMFSMAAKAVGLPEKYIDQSSLCVARSDSEALECPEDELFMAQLAIQESDLQNELTLEDRLLKTMAIYCNVNFPIQHTRTGVLCVLTHQRIEVFSEEDNIEKTENPG